MTPASEIALSPARTPGALPSGRTRRDGGAWERIFAVLGLCLPVPLLALSGLSIPLPAGVERIGAALVSWADPSADGGADPLGLGDRGSIVFASGERVVFQAPSEAEADTARRIAALSPVETTAAGAKDGGTPPKGEGGGGGGGGADGGNGGNGGSGGGSTPPDPGGGDSGDETGLVEETVKKVTEEPLVGEVENTLDELLPTGNDESSGDLLDDALSDLGL
jgi:hypothetical protein